MRQAIKRGCVGMVLCSCLGWANPGAAATPAGCAQQGWLLCSGLQLDTGWPGLDGSGSTGIRYNFNRYTDDALRPLRFHIGARVDTQPLLRRWRYGAGLNLDLPYEGMLEASLHTSRRRGRQGPRYALGDAGLTRSGESRRWALGTYIAPIKGAQGGRQLTVAPQARVDLDQYRLLPGRAELSIEYAPWERADRHHREDRAWQVNLYWSF